MVRFFGFLVGLGFVGVAAWSLLWGAIAYIGDPPEQTAEQRYHLEPQDIRPSKWHGFPGNRDYESLGRTRPPINGFEAGVVGYARQILLHPEFDVAQESLVMRQFARPGAHGNDKYSDQQDEAGACLAGQQLYNSRSRDRERGPLSAIEGVRCGRAPAFRCRA